VVAGLSGGGAIAYSVGGYKLYVRTFSPGAIGASRLMADGAYVVLEMEARAYGTERWLGVLNDHMASRYMWLLKDIDGCVYTLN
jgi:hypothetical protein